MKTFLIGVLAVLAGAGLWAQGGRPAVGPADQAPIVRTASVSGRVVDAETGSPVPGATVRLQMGLLTAASPFGRGGRGAAALSGAEQAASSGQDMVLTDSDGNFVFHDLPKGPAQLTATAPGYIVSNDATGRVYAPQRPLALDDGQHVTGALIRLRRHASISGQIVDEIGEPVVGFTVRALRRDAQSGTAHFVPSGTATTDDRGIYRIDGLVPATYIVVSPQTQATMSAATADMAMGLALGGGTAGALMEMVAGSTGGGVSMSGGIRVGDQLLQIASVRGSAQTVGPPVSEGRISVFASTYFPGAMQVSQATAITIRSGEDRAGVDWQMRPTPAARVIGRLNGPDGPVANQLIRLVAAPGSAADDQMPVATTTTAADGSFGFVGVPQGQYIAKAQRNAGMTLPPGVAVPPELANMMALRSSGSREILTAQLPIGVGDRDVTGLSMMLRPGAKVSGRVEFTGAAAQPTAQQLQALHVSLTPLEGGQMFGSAPLNAEGQFATPGQPAGRYNISWQGTVPAPWTMRSVMVGGRDVTMTGLEIADTDVGDVVVTFSDRTTTITGTVRAASGEVPASSILVVPADYRAWIAAGMNPRSMRTVQVPAQGGGAFTINNLAPLDYLLIAAPDDVLDTERDVAFFDAMARTATRVTLVAGDTKTVDLQLVRSIR